MNRRGVLGGLLALCCHRVLAAPSAVERSRIDKLIDAVAARTEICFIRNGTEYDSAQAAEFLRGKLDWRLDKVHTADDFIEQIGSRSTTSGKAYSVRLPGGQTIPSAEYLRLELARIEKR